MNKWTLKFNDAQLEQKYQEEQRLQQIQILGFTLLMSSLSCLIGGIHWVLDQKYIVGISLIIFSTTSPSTYYMVVVKRYFTHYVDHLLLLIQLLTAVYQFIPLIYNDVPLITQLWLTDALTLMVIQQSTSTNIIANTLLWAFFLTIKFGVRIQQGFNLISLGFSLFVLLSIYNDYQRIKILRQLFLQRAKYFQSNDILNKIVTESVVTLHFNKEQFKFDVIFTNQSFLKNISQDTYNFLKSVIVVKNRITFYSTIYQSIKKKLNQQEIHGRVDKQRYNLQCLIQYFDEIIITINIQKIYKKNTIKSLQFPFYRAILEKVKQSNKNIYRQERIKHLLAYLLYAPQKLNLQIFPLQSQQLYYIMSKYCSKVQIQYETTMTIDVL